MPLGTEREGWNNVRAADKRDEIAALVRRGAWRPPNHFVLDPREKNPGFHEFASDWLKRYRRTVNPRCAETAEGLPSRHVLPYLHSYTLKEIDYALLSAYVAAKLNRNDEIARANEVGVTVYDRHSRPRRSLSPRTINMSLDVISRVLNDAVKRGLLPSNPATDRELRLKVNQRKGTSSKPMSFSQSWTPPALLTNAPQRTRLRVLSWHDACVESGARGRRSLPNSA